MKVYDGQEDEGILKHTGEGGRKQDIKVWTRVDMAAPSQLAADQGRCRDGIPVKTSQISTGGREEKRPRKREDGCEGEKEKGIQGREREREDFFFTEKSP